MKPVAVTLPGQLVARHFADFPAGDALLVDVLDPGLAAALAARPGAAPCRIVQRERGPWKACREAGLAAEFTAWAMPGPRPAAAALIALPKSRALVALTLEMAAAALAPGAAVWVAGANAAGIRSADDDMARIIGPVERVETGRHSALLIARRTLPPPAPRALADRAERYTAAAAGRDLAVVSLPGVFSHGALDDGTRMLLATLEAEKPGRFLDFGCGCGVIAAALAAAAPGATVHAADASALALEATRLTLAANGFPAEGVIASDGLDEVDPPYDFIVSNPPFHTGVETDRGIAERFVRGAQPLLTRGGRLRLVANRFLRYAPLMEEVFKHVRVLAEDARFQVLEAKRR